MENRKQRASRKAEFKARLRRQKEDAAKRRADFESNTPKRRTEFKQAVVKQSNVREQLKTPKKVDYTLSDAGKKKLNPTLGKSVDKAIKASLPKTVKPKAVNKPKAVSKPTKLKVNTSGSSRESRLKFLGISSEQLKGLLKK